MAVMPAQKPGKSKQDYATPHEFIQAVKGLLGIQNFTHDFAASKQNAKAQTYYDEGMDALFFKPWSWEVACRGGWGWLNPPYSHIGQWADRCREVKRLNGNIAFLVPAGVGSNWFADYVFQTAMVLFLQPRICFIPNEPYPKDLMLCLFSPSWEPGFDVWRWK